MKTIALATSYFYHILVCMHTFLLRMLPIMLDSTLVMNVY